MPARPPSVHSTASSTDSEEYAENYVDMDPNIPTDEPVCNTQLLSDPRSHTIVFLIYFFLTTKKRKQRESDFFFFLSKLVECLICFQSPFEVI